MDTVPWKKAEETLDSVPTHHTQSREFRDANQPRMHGFGLVRKLDYLEKTPKAQSQEPNPQPQRCDANISSMDITFFFFPH